MRIGRAIDLFLAHVSDSASPATWTWYNAFLREFRLFAGERRLKDLRPSMVDKWIKCKYGQKSPSTQHAAGRAVCRLVNWAIDERHLDVSPLRTFRKVTPGRRELILSGSDYVALVKASPPHVRDVVKFLWHSGARPQELRIIEARWIRDRKITMPQMDSKGKKKRRVIYLDAMAAGIAARLSERNPDGPIFRDSDGSPWQKRALLEAFRDLRKPSGVAGVCAYTIRHTWITRLLERGVGVAAVAALAGNTPEVILRHYSHIAENEEHLRSHLG